MEEYEGTPVWPEWLKDLRLHQVCWWVERRVVLYIRPVPDLLSCWQWLFQVGPFGSQPRCLGLGPAAQESTFHWSNQCPLAHNAPPWDRIVRDLAQQLGDANGGHAPQSPAQQTQLLERHNCAMR